MGCIIVIYRRITNNNCNYFCKNNLIRGIISMCSSINEVTVNDAYLIEKDGKLYKCSYRKYLLNELRKIDEDAFPPSIKYDGGIVSLRSLVSTAAEKKYKIYQLTQL